MDKLELHLKECSIRVPRKMATGCWVSPSIGVTCAHAIPDGLDLNDEFDVVDDKENLLKAIILKIQRHRNEDLCIFTVPGVSRSRYLVLKDDVTRDDKVFGMGYPIYDDEQIGSGFKGIYVSSFNFLGPDFPVGMHKLSDGHIKKGFSGTGVINVRNGCCIGIVCESIDPRNNLGGLLTKAEFILQHLNSFPEFASLDTTIMAEFWNGICSSSTEDKKSLQSRLRIRRRDEAYICDRVFFSTQFENYWQSLRTTPVQHYLIIGEARHSPLGVAKKLTYESFTLSNKQDVKYPNDPTSGISPPVLQLPTNFIQFLKTLFNNHFKEDSRYNKKIWEMNEKDVIRYLLDQYQMGEVTILQIRVIINDIVKDLKSLLEMINDFVTAVNLEVATRRGGYSSKVLFFWCFEHKNRSKDLTTAITRSLLQRFSKQPIPEQAFIEYFFPDLTKRKLQLFLQQNGAEDFWAIPLNNCEPLVLPPRDDIQRWIDAFENESGGAYRIPNKTKDAAMSVNDTTELEKEFTTIIDDFNNKIQTGSWTAN